MNKRPSSLSGLKLRLAASANRRCDRDNQPVTGVECLAITAIRGWPVKGCGMKGLRSLFALMATVSLGVLGTGTVRASTGLTCSGTFTAPGSVAPGTYSSITVVGFCLGPPSGNVNVQGDVTVTKGSVLAANYPAFAPGAPEGDANWLAEGSVDVETGGTLLLGCANARRVGYNAP